MNAHVIPQSRYLRCVLFCAAIALSTPAWAFQPVEVGLQPVMERLQQIAAQQQRLNDRLQSPATPPKDRAEAYRAYVEIDLERRRLACSARWSRQWATSPLVLYAAPASEGPCSGQEPAVWHSLFESRAEAPGG